MEEKTPLISCICVTLMKPHKLDVVIACFDAQTYSNKQLVILYEDHDQLTMDFIREKSFSDEIKIVEINHKPKKTLGELRNIAIEQADGEYICQWDDDDWYHINRLQYQYEALTTARRFGSILRHWLILDSTKNKLYISHARNWEGSLLCRKELFLIKNYDESSKGEDTAVVEFLSNNYYTVNIDEITGMYVYVYHGGNTWDSEHFKKIFDCSHEVTMDLNIGESIFNLSPIEGSKLIDEILLSNKVIAEEAIAFSN